MYTPGEIVGDYRILAGPLGHEPSGFGEVYKAELTTQPGAWLALKFNSRFDADSITRFEQENKILKILEGHDGIIKTNTDILIDDKTSKKYYSMELADSNIAEHLAINPLTEPKDILNLFRQICEAVEYAHGMDVVHRDMHYGNILLSREAGILQVKVTDFGRAKHFGSPNSGYPAGMIWGRKDTRAPESYFEVWSVADQTSYALSSDIYSLGVLLSFLFGIDPQMYIFANLVSLAQYVQANDIGIVNTSLDININNMTKGDRLLHYNRWIPTFLYDSEITKLRVLTKSADVNDVVNKIIKKCCEPNYSNRYSDVSAIIEEMDGLC